MVILTPSVAPNSLCGSELPLAARNSTNGPEQTCKSSLSALGVSIENHPYNLRHPKKSVEKQSAS